MDDLINNPPHYTAGRQYEPIEVILDWGLGYCLGNALKYLSRAGRKENIVADLKKAVWYINKHIKEIENGKK